MHIEVKIFFGTSSCVLSNTHVPADICYLSILNLREKMKKFQLNFFYRASRHNFEDKQYIFFRVDTK